MSGDIETAASAIGRTALAVIVALFVTLVGIVFGPTVEAALFPVIRDHVVTYSIEGNRIVVDHELDKARQCPIEHRVRTVRDALESRPLRFTGPVNRVDRGTGHHFRSHATMPEGIAPPFDVTGTYYYRCHGLWLTPYRLPTVTVTADARR